MNRFVVAAMLVGLSFTQANFGLAQSSKAVAHLRREIEVLKTGQLSIQKDLAEIKNLLLQKELQAARDQLQGRQVELQPMRGPFPGRSAPNVAPTQAQPPSAPAAETQTVVSVDGGAMKGDRNAKVTVVEFTDYQCPFCSRHFHETYSQLDNDYVKTGKVRYVLRDFPLEAIHPNAYKAAEAANCAGEQGKYWDMHERFFSNQNTLGAQDLLGHAQAVGLDVDKFKACLDGGKYTAKVHQDLNDAQKYGVTGTPTFFVGLTDPKSKEVKAVRRIIGAQPYAAFKVAIDALLNN